MTWNKTRRAQRQGFDETSTGEFLPGPRGDQFPQYRRHTASATLERTVVPLPPGVLQEHQSPKVIFHDPLTNGTGLGAQERRTRRPDKDFSGGPRRNPKRSAVSRAKAIDAVTRDLATLALKGTPPPWLGFSKPLLGYRPLEASPNRFPARSNSAPGGHRRPGSD